MNDWLDSWTKRYTMPTTARQAMRWAMRHEHKDEHPPVKRPPMEWPQGSLHSRQTSMLKWLESLGHKVDYGPGPIGEPRNRIAKPTMTAAETSAWLRNKSNVHGDQTGNIKS